MSESFNELDPADDVAFPQIAALDADDLQELDVRVGAAPAARAHAGARAGAGTRRAPAARPPPPASP